MTQGVEVVINPPQRVPANTRVGFYYAPYQVPYDTPVGLYRVRWHFWESSSSPEMEAVEDFSVAAGGLTPYFYTPAVTALISRLRILLRDNNPDRNYRFAPPSSEDEIQNLTRTFGYIWEDYELVEYLQMALDRTNMYPPETDYSLDTLRADLKTMIAIGGSTYAFMARAANWALDEFSYSISAVSLDIDKMSKYEALKDNAEAMYDKMVEQFKASLHIMKGLSQPRYGIGLSITGNNIIQLHNIPESIKIYGFENVKEISVKDIVDKHAVGVLIDTVNFTEKVIEPLPLYQIILSGKKPIFRLETSSGKWIEGSEAHELYRLSGSKVVIGELQVGDEIACVEEDKIISESIIKKEAVGEKLTYDLSFLRNYNFILNGVITSNSVHLGPFNKSGVVSPRSYASFNTRSGF